MPKQKSLWVKNCSGLVSLRWFRVIVTVICFCSLYDLNQPFIQAAEMSDNKPVVSLEKSAVSNNYTIRKGLILQISSMPGVVLGSQASKQSYLATDFMVGYAFYDNCNKSSGICLNASVSGKLGLSLLPSSQVYSVNFGFVGEILMLFDFGKLSRLLGPYLQINVGAGLSHPYGEQFYVPSDLKFNPLGNSQIDFGTDIGVVVRSDALFQTKLPMRFKLGVSVSRNAYGNGVNLIPLKIGVEINL